MRGALVMHGRDGPELIRRAEINTPPSSEGVGFDRLSVALQKLLKQFSLARVHVNISLPASSYFIARYELPNVAAKKIGDMMLDKLEDHRLPFPLEESTISYAVQPRAPRGTFVAVTAPRQKVYAILSKLQSAGVTSFYLLPGDATLLNCVDYTEAAPRGRTVAAFRLGRKESVLTFFDDEGFRLRRIIPVGRRDLDRNMSPSGTGRVRSESEIIELYREGTAPLPSTGDAIEEETGLHSAAAKRNTHIQGCLGGIASEIQKTFHFYKNRIGKSEVNSLFLIDDFRGLPNIDAYFEEKLQIETRFLNGLGELPFAGKAKDEIPTQAEGSRFTLAVGSALELRGDLNLIPRNELFLPRLRVCRLVTRLTTIVLSVIMILLLLVIFFAVYLPPLEAYEEQSALVRESHARIETNLPRFLSAATLEARLQEITGEMAGLNGKIAAKFVKGDVAISLRKKAKELELVIMSEMPWVTNYHEMPSAGTEPEKKRYREHEKQMSLRGTYLAIALFMDEIEKLNLFARNTVVRIDKKDGDDNALEAHLKVTLYDLRELTFE